MLLPPPNTKCGTHSSQLESWEERLQATNASIQTLVRETLNPGLEEMAELEGTPVLQRDYALQLQRQHTLLATMKEVEQLLLSRHARHNLLLLALQVERLRIDHLYTQCDAMSAEWRQQHLHLSARLVHCICISVLILLKAAMKDPAFSKEGPTNGQFVDPQDTFLLLLRDLIDACRAAGNHRFQTPCDVWIPVNTLLDKGEDEAKGESHGGGLITAKSIAHSLSVLQQTTLATTGASGQVHDTAHDLAKQM